MAIGRNLYDVHLNPTPDHYAVSYQSVRADSYVADEHFMIFYTGELTNFVVPTCNVRYIVVINDVVQAREAEVSHASI